MKLLFLSGRFDVSLYKQNMYLQWRPSTGRMYKQRYDSVQYQDQSINYPINTHVGRQQRMNLCLKWTRHCRKLRCLNTCNTPALSLKLDHSYETLTGYSFTLRVKLFDKFQLPKTKIFSFLLSFFCEQQVNMWIQRVSTFVSTPDVEQDSNSGYSTDL